jgi:tRNA pseudouridine55 synthase
MTDGNVDSGALLVDKEPDWTSHDVVKFIRRFGFKKVGHCGTLDPFATGLLIIVIGKATKLSNLLSGHDKDYLGTLTLGVTTDSQDRTGAVIAEADWSTVTEDELRNVMDTFKGDIEQVPPMVSAIKRGGKKLYELARQGIEIHRDPRPITIHEMSVLTVDLPDATFRVKCSKGTYVRTLSNDIGDKLGCGGHLKDLRRLGSGPFSVDGAVSMETLKQWSREDVVNHMIPIDKIADLLGGTT